MYGTNKDRRETKQYGKRQPRKPLRKQGTRKGAVLVALKEAQR